MAVNYSRAEAEREHYISWLAERVDGYLGSVYSRLIHCLWEIPFVWSIEDDGNRAVDGNTLRIIFKQSHKLVNPELVFPTPDGCTFLEFLVALAGRANEIMYVPDRDQTGDFFWLFIKNMCLDHCVDDMYGISWDEFFVSSRIAVILSRAYGTDGMGGLFPLKCSVEDQRNLTIWYQLNAFLNENY